MNNVIYDRDKAIPMSKRWKIFWIIWLSCLAPVVWSLMYGSGPQLAAGKPIARIEKIKGKVTVRSESQIIEQPAQAEQQLYNNDIIQTDAGATVNIVFEGGRKLQLTPGSVVKLGLPSPLSSDHEISVLKGRLVVKADEGKPEVKADGQLPANTGIKNANIDNRIILKTTQNSVVDSSVKTQTIDVPVKQEQIKPAASAISLSSLSNLNINDSMKLSAMTAPVKEICPPPPAPVIIPEPAPVAEAAEFEKATIPSFEASLLPQILPLSGEFWTAEPMKKVTDQALRLDVDLPVKLPRDLKEKWKGIVNISGPNGHIRIDGKAAGGRKKLSITLKDLMTAQVIKDVNQASFAVNAGYSMESPSFNDAIEHSSPTTSVYSLRSLAEGEGIMVGFDKITVGSSAAPWYFVNPKPNKKIWIGVTEPEDRKKLFSVVQGNGGDVSRADWPGIPARGAFIVRDDKIVGIVSARDLSSADWEKIRKLFKADLIFRGLSQSYISKTGFDVNKTNERTLFALNRGEFVELDVSLLRTRPNTMRFVQGLSTFLFREQPQILSIAQ